MKKLTFVTLLDYTNDPVNTIGDRASICYDADTSREKNIKRASHCKDKGHLMTLRFAYATFNIRGISRIASHQLVRVAHAGILQESQRYVKQSSIEWVVPPAIKDTSPDFIQEWGHHLVESNRLYQKALDLGIKKEDARYILPQSCTTQLNITGNFQMWRDLLNNRTKPAAQWEIREIAIEIQRKLHNIAPEIF